MKRILLLGASGNIGQQVIDVWCQHPDLFEVSGVSAGNNAEALRKILQRFPIKYACIRKEEDCLKLQKEFPDVTFFWGDKGLVELCDVDNYDLLVNALLGFSGLQPTLKAIEKGHDVALANKETLVAGGALVKEAARKHNVSIIPIDSEHSAIFQCLEGNDRKAVNKLIITASGGSFRDLSRDQLKDVTVEQALAHPNWLMGHKITIDSATMMNKGFEVIEASWLFDIPLERIETVLHKESVVHSMVEFVDHSVLAQLGNADMRIPIQHAVLYPHRLPNDSKPLNLAAIGELHFKKMDFKRFPLLKLAYDTAEKGGNLPAVMNGANEKAVSLFLNHRISFLEIEELVFKTVEAATFVANPTLADIIASNDWAYEYAEQLAGGSK